MKKYLIPLFALIVYIFILIKFLVLKDVPTIKIGNLMLNFGGTIETGAINLIPFKTILPYLAGYKGWIIAGINLAGNIIFLVPVGFLIPFIYPNISWRKILLYGSIFCLLIEVMQIIMRVGIFDIDDVILNVFGVMIGFWFYLVVFSILKKMMNTMKVKNIIIVIAIFILIIFASTLYLFEKLELSFVASPVSQTKNINNTDLCGGSKGTGEIISIGNDTISIKRNDGSSQNISISDETNIKNSTGSISKSDLKIGDRVTIVIFDSKAASAVLVCDAINNRI